MSLTNNLINKPKDIFLIDLLATKKKEYNNSINDFDNTKECIINFVDIQIIKIIRLVRLNWGYNYYNLKWRIYMICYKVQKIDWVKYVLIYIYDYQAKVQNI